MTSLVKYRPILLFALFFSYASLAQERREIPDYRVFGMAENKQDENQIAQLIDRYGTAWRELDSAALIALHAENTEWTNAFARIFQSSKALALFIDERLFPEFRKTFSDNDSLTITPISIRYLGDDAAVVHLYAEFQGSEPRNINETVRRTHFHLVLEQMGSEWKIAHTAIMDAR